MRTARVTVVMLLLFRIVLAVYRCKKKKWLFINKRVGLKRRKQSKGVFLHVRLIN